MRTLATLTGLYLMFGAAYGQEPAPAEPAPKKAPRTIEEVAPPKYEELNDVREIPLGEVAPVDNACFDPRRIFRTRVIDQKNVIVWAPNRRSPHLLRLDHFCFGLRPGSPIAIRAGGTRVCGRGGDEVRTVESRCRIVAVAPIPYGQEELVEEQVRAESEMERAGRR